MRNVLIVIEEHPTEVYAQEEIKFRIRSKRYPTNVNLPDIPITVVQNDRIIANNLRTDAEGALTVSINFAEKGAYNILFLYTGDTSGNTGAARDLDVKVLDPLPPYLLILVIVLMLGLGPLLL